MPVSAEIFSVDTVRIEPVSQAFRTGQLNMSSVPLDVPVIAKGWADLPVNWITIAVCTIAVIIFLNSFIGLMPYIFGGFLRWKEIVHLENSVRLTRDRNTIAIIAFLIRKTQIMSNACGQVAAFLYLCSLELLPAGLLIASNFVF